MFEVLKCIRSHMFLVLLPLRIRFIAINDPVFTVCAHILKSGKIGCKKACVYATSQAQNRADKGFILVTPKTASKILQSGYIAPLAIYPL